LRVIHGEQVAVIKFKDSIQHSNEGKTAFNFALLLRVLA